MTLALLNL